MNTNGFVKLSPKWQETKQFLQTKVTQ